ncbi:hypothetical protein [Mycolicibacterium fortuitum]|uniref:Uncharacterized protein n=1 Tax=Mycolicibacterium fortuitum TaxID=1766 RepID=A0AAE4VHW1_MYCFO|nr:hypothetical protein [Mycolicibacterium fortuitum]MDV7195892.1 hypothetical protein [Mycolicibacterium fortuitum]MDV7207659.1 hypothetical protein [Mycolicibacterium fortuitum]MDV7229715.1 hypothetical protein [Mycolicibacterium fortuitum]MDV7261532.1 hypothetical protein [Mycolicibacterium fortuitum]MDV7286688.1 hypothetical protein [Mycolicibacterium fortuitum]
MRTVHKRTARAIVGTLSAAVLVGTGIGWTARAFADPTFAVDSHVPNPALGWCPGGGDGGLGAGFCDGKPYADNTKWHFVRGFIPFKGWTTSMQCVINTGELLQPPAGPGGCGGAV